MKGSITLAAAAAAAALFAATPVAGSPDVGFTRPDGGSVTFALSSGARILTGLPAADGQRVAWSPDGGRLAFVCGDFALCVADHGAVREVTHTDWPKQWEYDGDPAWSPDGKTLAFDATSGGGRRIYIVSAVGGTPHLLMRTALPHEELPTWSPTGKQLAFDARVGKHSAIYVVSSNGRGLRRLTATTSDAHSATWSGDGKLIAFTIVTKRGSGIDVIAVTGGSARALTPGKSRDDHPAWSPDGKTIAFDSNRSGPVGIWTVAATGGVPTQLDAGTAGPDLFPSWKPSSGGSTAPLGVPGARDPDASLVSAFITWSFRVGADVFTLHAGKQQAVAAIARAAAAADNSLGRIRPVDARGRRFLEAARIAFAQASIAGHDYDQMLASLHGGDRPGAFRHAKAGLHELTIFGRSLQKANAIAGLS